MLSTTWQGKIGRSQKNEIIGTLKHTFLKCVLALVTLLNQESWVLKKKTRIKQCPFLSCESIRYAWVKVLTMKKFLGQNPQVLGEFQLSHYSDKSSEVDRSLDWGLQEQVCKEFLLVLEGIVFCQWEAFWPPDLCLKHPKRIYKYKL